MSEDLLTPDQLYPAGGVWGTTSRSVKDFIIHLLTMDDGTDGASHRYTTDDCINHLWLASVNKEQLANVGCNC